MSDCFRLVFCNLFCGLGPPFVCLVNFLHADFWLLFFGLGPPFVCSFIFLCVELNIFWRIL